MSGVVVGALRGAYSALCLSHNMSPQGVNAAAVSDEVSMGLCAGAVGNPHLWIYGVLVERFHF
jgi:hypothetical protein